MGIRERASQTSLARAQNMIQQTAMPVVELWPLFGQRVQQSRPTPTLVVCPDWYACVHLCSDSTSAAGSGALDERSIKK
jgi:hypothetical protein